MRRQITAIGLAAAAVLASADDKELPPIGAFMDEPEFGLVSISPGGNYLAQYKRVDGNGLFHVVTYPEREVRLNYNLGESLQVASMTWLSDTLILASPRRYTFGADFLVPTGELYAVDVESGSVEGLSPGAPLHPLPDDPDHILMLKYENLFAEAHRLNIRNGHTRRLTRSATRSGRLLPDVDGRLTMSVGVNADYDQQVHHRRDGERWRVVGEARFGGQGWAPLLHGPTPDTWFTLDSRGASTDGLGLYNSADGSHEIIIRHPTVDVTQILVDADRRPYAVRFDHHYPALQYLDDRHPLAQQHAAISKMYPDDFVTFTSSSRDHRVSVAYVHGDRRPGDFVLVDLESRKVEPLARRRAHLTPEMLAPMQPIEFRVRDGSTAYGYLTSAADAPRPGPMVVVIHGGPHGVRDYWGFNAEVQLLASRGYHVLSVNYRGSGGYGHRYMSEGFGEWGGLMQDDVTDATQWAIDTGVADAERICIYGASYGAYSALMGAAREPDLYRCAIGAAGIYDLSRMEAAGDVRSLRGGMAYIRKILRGNQDMPERSPVNLAERIKARVLLMHGGFDRRAPPEHARRLRKALERAGNAPEWMYKVRQGHGVAGDEAARQTYGRVLDFLAEHTAPRVGT